MTPLNIDSSKVFVAFFSIIQISLTGMSSVQAGTVQNKQESNVHSVESMRMMKAREDDQALLEIDRAIKLGAGPAAFTRKAEILLNLGRPKQALVEARKSEKLDPQNADIHALLGSILASLKLDAEALSELNFAIAKKPSDRVFRTRRAKIYEKQGQYEKAAIDLTVVINNTDKQNRSKFFERRGKCYSALKDYSKAVSDFSAAMVGSYVCSELLRLRASAYDKQGNQRAAKKDVRDASMMDEMFEPPKSLGENK